MTGCTTTSPTSPRRSAARVTSRRRSTPSTASCRRSDPPAMSSRIRWAARIVALAVSGALVAPAGAAAAAAVHASTPRAKQPAYEETIHLTVDDLQDYWATELPAL